MSEPIQDDIEMIRLCLTANDLAPPPYPGAIAALDRLVAERDREREAYRGAREMFAAKYAALEAERSQLREQVNAGTEQMRSLDQLREHLVAERDGLNEALKEASLRECERMYGNPNAPTCRSPVAYERLDRDSWCASCIAREALTKTTEEQG
jgi:hypothetical protein